jgi:hypothetical protein
MKHAYTLNAYEIKTGGFRGVLFNRETKERQTSDVLATLDDARNWTKKAIWDAIPSGAFTIAPYRRKGEYLANVWTA